MAAREAEPPAAAAGSFQQRAVLAWRTGQAALAGGDRRAARAELERACRLAPDDDAAALALALLRLGEGETGPAVVSLAALAPRLDAREAWLALAAGRLGQRQPEQAAEALARAFGGHVLPDRGQVDALADAVVAASGAAGWCGLDRRGRLAASRGPAPELWLDGVATVWRARLRLPAGVARVELRRGGVALIGSPLAPARLRRVAGVVAEAEGGIAGWAWHPADPDTDPVLRIVPAGGGRGLRVTARDRSVTAAGPLARPRGFGVPAAALARFAGPLRVLGPDGEDLPGSPLDPGGPARAARAVARLIAREHPLGGAARDAGGLALAAVEADWRGRPARAPLAPGRPVAVVVPVSGGAASVADCLAALRATVPDGSEIVVVDDASEEGALRDALAGWQRAGRIRLLRHASRLGLAAAANTGLRAAARLPGARDLVLLNSDTRPAPGWLDRLRAAVHAAPDIGTATPFSNDAAIMSYQPPGGPPADRALARLAGRVLAGEAVELPTAIGSCIYVRRECLRETGLLRPEIFAQGDGEVVDFSLRARHLGWRHVGVPGAWVTHVGARACGAAGAALHARNQAVLERLHPGYRALVAAFRQADPLFGARRRLDAARWAAGRREAGAVLLVSHDRGGGVERALAERCAAIRAEARRAIVLRPVLAEGDERRHRPGWCGLGDGVEGGFADLRFHLPDELDALARLLRADRPVALELHHLLGHDHAVTGLAARLRIPTDIHVHDYASFCPRVTLIGPGGRYCGEPERVEVCEACIADCGSALEEEIGVAALRARSAADLAAARRIVVPAEDVAARLRRHFPGIVPEVAPLEDDSRLPRVIVPPRRARRLVAVIGAIGPAKGYDVLLACARDAAWRDLPLEFVLAGHTPDDARLLASGRVRVTGPYREAEAESLLRGLAADLALLPSIWPETWCYALGAAWRAGLRVAAFDIGTPAERIRGTGRGWLLPLGLPAAAMNNALLAVNPGSGDV